MKKQTILITLILTAIFILNNKSFSQQSDLIPFDKENWTFFNGEVVEHLGRQSLSGTARLTGVEFENGIIEFDMAINGKRSYPGIFFRVQSVANYEHFYIRPHRVGLYPDALQYAPAFNRSSCWQLFSGEGYTSAVDMPKKEWVHVKLEIKGNQARVFINNSKKPDLVINHLQHGNSKGGLTLNSPKNGTAYFSNFSYKIDDNIEFTPVEKEKIPYGTLINWEISQSYKIGKIDFEKTPNQQKLANIKWQKVECEPTGIVNLSKHIARFSREPDCIFARTTIHANSDELKELKFGYSDATAIFLNGKLLFSGNSAYRYRDPSFLGIMGLFDAVYLPLKKGDNELIMIVAESFGGWGFICQDGKATYMDKGLTKLWESEKKFATSESVLYDPKRETIYVTNFDQFNMGNPRAFQFISKVSLNGKIDKLKWVDSLNNPLGMTIYNDKLFVAERNAVAEIDLDKAKVIKRHPIQGSVFLNDIAIDKKGSIYITDSRKNIIWKYSYGKAEEWLSGSDVLDPNVIYIHENTLFFGNSGDQSLKKVNLPDKSIKTITKFETGFIDGFRIDENGDYLVSLWKGKVYRVTPQGEKTKILDTTTPGYFSADFEYIKEKGMLIIPTFLGNRITVYKFK